jgi:ATP-dependent Clp protease ATP-binding subunit ClpC
MKDLVKRIVGMGISISLTKQAREFLAERGYDPAFGARPLRRALQRYLEDPIAEELLKGKYPSGTTIKVRVNKKSETLRFNAVLPGSVEEVKAEGGEEKESGGERQQEKPADVS